MTINIAIAVSEGLVMAADSLSQMSDTKGDISCIHQSVEKIAEIRGRPIALMINGIGEINRRTIISLIREFEFIAYNKPGSPIRTWSLSTLASELEFFLRPHYEKAYPPPRAETNAGAAGDIGPVDTRQPLGIIVGGYSPGNYFPELIEISFPNPKWRRVLDSQGEEHIEYWGKTTSIESLIAGYDAERVQRAVGSLQYVEDLRTGKEKKPDDMDDEVYAQLCSDLPKPPANLSESLADIAEQICMDHRLRGMPLQEAVEFAEYLGNVAIGYDRFCNGRPAVGGELDVLAIQPDGLQWYRRKPFLREMAAAREQALRADDQARARTTVSDLLSSTLQSSGDETKQD